jgi:hypothetical protein
MNEYVSNIVYQSIVCLMYKIMTMMCIVFSICVYTQLNIDDDVKSSVKREERKKRVYCVSRGKIQVLRVVGVLRFEYIHRTIDS